MLVGSVVQMVTTLRPNIAGSSTDSLLRVHRFVRYYRGIEGASEIAGRSDVGEEDTAGGKPRLGGCCCIWFSNEIFSFSIGGGSEFDDLVRFDMNLMKRSPYL